MAPDTYPQINGYTMVNLPFKLRLNKAGTRVYAESIAEDSRALFAYVRNFLEENFVNVYPSAVRTFREAA
jgi:hypothetical protein